MAAFPGNRDPFGRHAMDGTVRVNPRFKEMVKRRLPGLKKIPAVQGRGGLAAAAGEPGEIVARSATS
jgi:hypothetical protein